MLCFVWPALWYNVYPKEMRLNWGGIVNNCPTKCLIGCDNFFLVPSPSGSGEGTHYSVTLTNFAANAIACWWNLSRLSKLTSRIVRYFLKYVHQVPHWFVLFRK